MNSRDASKKPIHNSLKPGQGAQVQHFKEDDLDRNAAMGKIRLMRGYFVDCALPRVLWSVGAAFGAATAICSTRAQVEG
jgi:hypothetical protein